MEPKMDINFELYKVFFHVAESLSFSEAASELCISQSAVSQSIKLLEEKLGSRLFLRSTKQVRLTQEGELLFDYVEKAFNYIKTGEQSLAELHSLHRGLVRIGASDTICKYYLLPYLQQFNRLYPQIVIKVTNQTSPKCLELLHNGSLDLGVVNFPEHIPFDNVSGEKLKEIRDVFIAGESFDHLRDKKISLAELAKYPLLMLQKDTVTRQFLERFEKEKGITLMPEIELGSMDLLVEMAKIGFGLSLVIQDFVEKELESGSVFVVNIKEKIPPRHLGFIINKKIPLPAAARRFLELLQQAPVLTKAAGRPSPGEDPSCL